MCPDVIQFLTYMAGRTTSVQLGSMVVVLPWHDPVRVAEQVAMLDNLSGGRVVLGMGRGLGKVEFDGFRVPMDESRQRFVEAAEMILAGLEDGYVKYEGTFFSQPEQGRAAARRSSRSSGRSYAAAISPESSTDHGRARRRHPHHPAEAVGRDDVRARHVPGHLPRR